MSNLTRIKNNQITDSTIWANSKIIPGSIVGSLFNSNITVTSDFTITGNLTVQGAATYLTVASTNTYVNDPLIVLNNAFAGTNQYDLGFIFNRGSLTNQAFYWDESTDEFKLIATSETGTTYGNIAAETSYSNFRLGNLYLNNYTATRALFLGASGLVTTDADYTFDSTNNVLKAGNFQFRGNTSTIATTGTNESITLLPSGTGIVDVGGFHVGNIADPLSGQDAVTLTYLQNALSSDVTNIQNDDTEVRVVDGGVDAGQINANVDATSALVIKSNSLSIFGTGYTGSSPKVFIDSTNSNVGIISTLFVSDDLTAGAGSIVRINDTTDASSITNGGAVTIKGGTAIAKKLYVGGIAEFDANVVINGNLIVNGNVTYFSSNNVTFNDALIYLADDNSADILDIGFISSFTNGVNFYQHTGFVRDATDGVWKLFANVAPEPTTTVNFTDADYSTLKVGNLTAVSAVTVGTSLNVAANVSAAELNVGTIKATGFINTAGNVSAATVIAGQFNTTGNLVASQVSTGTLNATGLINTLGNISASRINADTLASTGTIWANASTDTTSLATGALIVTGGTAVGKTMWVGEGMVVNSTQAAEQFHFKGQGTNNSLIYADAAKNAIVFGGANVTVQDGVVAKFNSTGAIQVPTGTNAQRPGSTGNVDVAGLVRFNTTSNNLEFYDGSAWTAAGSEFTVITTNTFNGDGSTVAFTLSSSSSTSGTLVMVNGVVQIPTTAYSVSGTTLTFTEAPATGDVIDARALITTAQVTSIASGDGYNTFDVATVPYANITAGTSSATIRVSVSGADGTFGLVNGTKTTYNQTVLNAPGTNLKELDSFATSKYSTAKYIVQIKDGSNIESAEVMLAQDTANIQLTTYAVIAPAGALGTFSCNIVSGSAKFWYTPTISTNANIKIQTTYIV